MLGYLQILPRSISQVSAPTAEFKGSGNCKSEVENPSFHGAESCLLTHVHHTPTLSLIIGSGPT
jgi:hypothetical protein